MKRLDNYELRINYIIDNYDYIMRVNPNIVGIGWGNKIVQGNITNTPALTIFVKKKYPKSYLGKENFIPPFIHGALTDIVEVGEQPELIIPSAGENPNPPTTVPNPKPTPTPAEPKPRQGIESRPAFAGESIGGLHDYMSGSIGYLVTERVKSENYYALTALHALDPSLVANKDKIKVLQPSKDKKGTIANSLYGTFEKGIPIKEKDPNSTDNKIINEVDAAIVKLGPKSQETMDKYLKPALNDSMHLAVTGIESVFPGSLGWKVGTQTGVTNCRITQTNVRYDVKYKGKILPFENQIIANIVCGVDDAGTLGVTSRQIQGGWVLNAWGLLMAPINSELAVFNSINRVFDLLDVKLPTM